jgi:hypothetical protein
MTWAAAWAFITKVLGPLIVFFNKVMANWAAHQNKQAGRDEMELEVQANEDRILDALRDINPNGLSDDEAFKP